jgi:hypothetical protein
VQQTFQGRLFFMVKYFFNLSRNDYALILRTKFIGQYFSLSNQAKRNRLIVFYLIDLLTIFSLVL